MRETRAATISTRDDGLLVVRIRRDVRQTLDDARANIEAAAAESGGARPGLLLDLTRAVPLDPPVRHYYNGPVVGEVCSALAILVEISPLGRMMGNVYLRVANLTVPTRVFDREPKALTWLHARARALATTARRGGGDGR
jgi:hypothetical protein